MERQMMICLVMSAENACSFNSRYVIFALYYIYFTLCKICLFLEQSMTSIKILHWQRHLFDLFFLSSLTFTRATSTVKTKFTLCSFHLKRSSKAMLWAVIMKNWTWNWKVKAKGRKWLLHVRCKVNKFERSDRWMNKAFCLTDWLEMLHSQLSLELFFLKGFFRWMKEFKEYSQGGLY